VLTSLSGATVRDGAKERQYVTPAIARSGETGRYRGEGGGRRGGGRKEGVPAGSRVRARYCAQLRQAFTARTPP
jgi:hypothetical protein